MNSYRRAAFASATLLSVEPELCRFVDDPSVSLEFNSVQLSIRIIPAENAACGGDWCETFVVAKDVIALSIGDVSGHGVEQNASMARIRSAIRKAALTGLDPAQTLVAANEFLLAFKPDLQATAIIAFLDTTRATLTFANAGHPPPILVDDKRATFIAIPHTDAPLGTQVRFCPAVHDVELPSGALLVLYTDGVIEHDRQSLRGELELLEAAKFAARCSITSVAVVIEHLMSLTGTNRDDASILSARMPRAEVASNTTVFERPRRRGQAVYHRAERC